MNSVMRNSSKSLHRFEGNNANNAYGTVRNYTSLFVWVCFKKCVRSKHGQDYCKEHFNSQV